MAQLLSLRAYARHRGVALQAVQKAIQTGRIRTVKDASGKDKIDPDISDREWGETTDASKQRSGPEGSGSASSASQTYAKARAMREAYLAQVAKLTYEEKIGKLVDADTVRTQTFETARVVRDAILNIPNRIAHELASETDPLNVQTLLTTELTKALEELANAGRRRAGIE